MIKSLIQPIAVTCCLTVLICWLFLKSRQTGHAEYDHFSQLLTVISRLDAEMNAEVLKLEFQLHKSYDRLAQLEQNFVQCTRELDKYSDLAFGGDADRREALLQPILQKQRLVTDFKSRHAVLGNSVAIFYGMSEKLGQCLTDTSEHAEARIELLHFQKACMEFVLNAGGGSEEEIRRGLEKIRSWPIDASETASRYRQVLLVHVENLLKARPLMDQLLRELNQLSVPESLYAMRTSAARLSTLANKKAAGYQLQLLAAALLLIGYCGYSIYSIGKYVRTIRLANEQLEERVLNRTRELEAKSEALRSNGRFLSTVLDAMDAKICILGDNGRIDATNAVWDARRHDPTWLRPGADYLRAFDDGSRTIFGAPEVTQALREMKQSSVRSSAVVEYDTTTPSTTDTQEPNSRQWIQARINKMPAGPHGYLGFVVALIDITQRVKAEEEKDKLNRQLQTLSRQAGMAEVATGVLHNVGNVLNSINIASSQATRIVRTSRLASLQKAEQLVQQHLDDFASFVAEDPRGQQLPKYITQIARTWEEEQAQVLTELEDLTKHIEHVKHVINVQQVNAKISTVTQDVNLYLLIEDAITTIAPALKATKIELVKEFHDLPMIQSDPHKIMQILINLLSNAKHALQDSTAQSPRIVVTSQESAETLTLKVIDNGVGIAAENVSRICQHGFTTKKNGHGFGLHSCALLAKELGGELEFSSPGVNLGATFSLVLPKIQISERSGTQYSAD